jgi:drug/metabolite transporter (DMT)-like permease
VAAIALGFASAVVWGLGDFLGGLKSRKLALLAVLFVSQGGALLLLVPAAAIRGEGLPDASIVPWCALAAVAGVLGLAAFYRGLATGAMGVVAPLSSCAAAIPVAVGIASGERPSAIQGLGVALAIAGVAAASLEPRAAERERARRAPGPGVTLALLAALGFGFFFVFMDRAADRDLLWALLIQRIASTTILAGAVLAMRPKLGMSGADLRAILAVGFLDVSANALFAAGTTLGLVSVVSVLGSLYPVTTTLLARFLLHERLRAVQRGGAALALAGVALISAG